MTTAAAIGRQRPLQLDYGRLELDRMPALAAVSCELGQLAPHRIVGGRIARARALGDGPVV